MPEKWSTVPMPIRIENGEADPTGDVARMSRSGNGLPRLAFWEAVDRDYKVVLPATVWAAPNEPPPPTPPPPGSHHTFKVSKGQRSGTYSLWQNAATGEQSYSIEGTDAATGPPSVMVDP